MESRDSYSNQDLFQRHTSVLSCQVKDYYMYFAHQEAETKSNPSGTLYKILYDRLNHYY